jgi:SOS-response transcriptional repressor LexA
MRSNSEDALKGTTLEVYKYVLKNGKPTGVREIQRALNLSSPRLAAYHLDKLEDVELLRKTMDGYVVNRVLLQNSVRVSRILVPRFFFYSVFFITIIALQLTVFKPTILSKEYLFSVVAVSIAAALFLYETLRVLFKKRP